MNTTQYHEFKMLQDEFNTVSHVLLDMPLYLVLANRPELTGKAIRLQELTQMYLSLPTIRQDILAAMFQANMIKPSTVKHQFVSARLATR